MKEKYLYFNIITHKINEWDELNEIQKEAFIQRIFDAKNYNTPKEHYDDKASTLAEYSKIINISFGYQRSDGNWKDASVSSLNEVELLRRTSAVLDAFAVNGYFYAGFNVTYYDIPYLTKRYIINNIRIPDSLKRYDKKYWEINDFNLKQFWKFNGYSEAPLDLICNCLGIDIKDLNDIYKVFGTPIGEIDLSGVSKLSELRNQLVHEVHNRVMDLIE